MPVLVSDRLKKKKKRKKETAEAFRFWRPGTKQSQRKDQPTFKHFSEAGHILAMMQTADRPSAEEDISEELLKRGKKQQDATLDKMPLFPFSSR